MQFHVGLTANANAINFKWKSHEQSIDIHPFELIPFTSSMYLILCCKSVVISYYELFYLITRSERFHYHSLAEICFLHMRSQIIISSYRSMNSKCINPSYECMSKMSILIYYFPRLDNMRLFLQVNTWTEVPFTQCYTNFDHACTNLFIDSNQNHT